MQRFFPILLNSALFASLVWFHPVSVIAQDRLADDQRLDLFFDINIAAIRDFDPLGQWPPRGRHLIDAALEDELGKGAKRMTFGLRIPKAEKPEEIYHGFDTANPKLQQVIFRVEYSQKIQPNDIPLSGPSFQDSHVEDDGQSKKAKEERQTTCF